MIDKILGTGLPGLKSPRYTKMMGGLGGLGGQPQQASMLGTMLMGEFGLTPKDTGLMPWSSGFSAPYSGVMPMPMKQQTPGTGGQGGGMPQMPPPMPQLPPGISGPTGGGVNSGLMGMLMRAAANRRTMGY